MRLRGYCLQAPRQAAGSPACRDRYRQVKSHGAGNINMALSIDFRTQSGKALSLQKSGMMSSWEPECGRQDQASMLSPFQTGAGPCDRRKPKSYQSQRSGENWKMQRYIAMDGLRGVAAIAVAIGHLPIVIGTNAHFPGTALAVDFFFILSGFVLSNAYAVRLARGDWFFKFLKIRIIRLMPLIWIGTLVGAAAYFVNGADPILLGRLSLQGALLIPEPGINPLDASFFLSIPRLGRCSSKLLQAFCSDWGFGAPSSAILSLRSP